MKYSKEDLEYLANLAKNLYPIGTKIFCVKDNEESIIIDHDFIINFNDETIYHFPKGKRHHQFLFKQGIWAKKELPLGITEINYEIY